jgi:hypothetical protein
MSVSAYDPSVRELERQYHVVLPDTLGHPVLGFRDGIWFRLSAGGAPTPVPVRSAILSCPHAAGSVVQIICWWMREHRQTARALDLATELALTVGELARGINDPLGLSFGSSSLDSGSLGSSGSHGSPGSLGSSGSSQLSSSSTGSSGSLDAPLGGTLPHGSSLGGSSPLDDPLASSTPRPAVGAAMTTVIPAIPADPSPGPQPATSLWGRPADVPTPPQPAAARPSVPPQDGYGWTQPPRPAPPVYPQPQPARPIRQALPALPAAPSPAPPQSFPQQLARSAPPPSWQNPSPAQATTVFPSVPQQAQAARRPNRPAYMDEEDEPPAPHQDRYATGGYDTRGTGNPMARGDMARRPPSRSAPRQEW